MFKRHIIPFALITFFFVILLIGCKDSNSQEGAQTQVQPQTGNDVICDTLVSSGDEQILAIGNDTITTQNLPRMLELGSVGCRPCDMMTPILDELRVNYKDRLSVEFYDVKKNPAPAQKYRIRLIPTQIFLDAEGNEFFRHEGYYPTEEIVKVLSDMGIN